MYILIAILMFGFLIFIHELGHFLTAKALDVQVNEFSICMGPAIVKKQRGETLYALRCIPGSPPDLARLPAGCAFADRCPHARAACGQSQPATEQAGERHVVSCHRWRELAASVESPAQYA